MNKRFLFPILITVMVSLGSCTIPDGEEEVETPNTNQTQETQGETEAVSSPETESETSEEETAIEEPEEPEPEVSQVAGLRKATDPEDFLQQRGSSPGASRGDPFSLFPVSPQEEVTPPPPPPVEEGNTTTDALPSLPESSEPPPPQPELARAVIVQGTVQVGNRVLAILKAPNEETSRYVGPGQLIANDQVLVKEIRIEGLSLPQVVLEDLQIDQEVIKSVGTEVEVETDPVSNVSAMTLPPPPPLN